VSTPADLTENREPITLDLMPGFFTEASAKGTPGRWKTGDKVRFQGKQPEKMGGWLARALNAQEGLEEVTRATEESDDRITEDGDIRLLEDGDATGDGSGILGVPRRVHEWTSLDGEAWIAVGTNRKLLVVNRDQVYDITPVRRRTSVINPFTTTNGSAVVTVSDPAHSANVGDAVRFTGASDVGGLSIVGEYTITAVTDGDVYQITHSSPATSGASGGGSVAIEYDIDAGTASQTVALGFGVCGYGEGTYGTARSAACSGVVRRMRLWSLDNFGEDLIASPRGGPVYHWDRTNGPLSRAVVLPDAPRTNQRVLISNSGGQIVCLGAFDDVSNTPDPMFVRVGEEESLTGFVVDDENTAFEDRCAVGSEIVTGVRTRGGIFIGTDEAAYIMQEDPFEIYVLNKLAEGNAPIAPNAMLEKDGVVTYMAPWKFMRFDGVLEEVPCDVWRYVFEDPATRIDREQADKIYSWYNEKFDELWWLYPSEAGSGENDRYVILNDRLKCWYFGTIERTAAASPGPSYDLPFAFDSTGALFLHETGVNANVSAMDSHIESHDQQITTGKKAMHISQAVPDMVRQTGTLLLYLKGKKRPNQPAYVEKGPYTITTTTEVRGVRLSSRQVAVRFQSNTLGADWRLGDWQFYAQEDAEG
jgi:hypothetical protein